MKLATKIYDERSRRVLDT